MVGEGWHREVSPYPDLRRNLAVGGGRDEGPESTLKRPSGSARELALVGPRPPRDDGQIGMSVGSAGALHDVERRDRPLKTF